MFKDFGAWLKEMGQWVSDFDVKVKDVPMNTEKETVVEEVRPDGTIIVTKTIIRRVTTTTTVKR